MIRFLRWGVLATLTALQGGPALSAPDRLDSVARQCMTVTSDSIAPPLFAEPHAAADPRAPDHLVAAWQVIGGPAGLILTAASRDGGASWSAPRTLAISACAGGPAQARRASDPWVAIGPDGRAYVAAIGWSPGSGGAADGYNAIMVAASPDGGTTWGSPVTAALGDAAAGISHDNVSIAADPTRPGVVYLATTRYHVVRDTSGRSRRVGPIGFARSEDGGRSWSPLRLISSPEVTAGRVSAPQLVVDPSDGRLMVFYFRFGGGARIGWQFSTDAGESWSAEQQIAPVVRAVDPIDSLLPRGRAFVFASDILQAVVDGRRGALYLAYADGRRDPGGKLGLSLVASFDRGATWGEPVSVSPDGPVTAWLPAVAVGPDGEVGVAYLTGNFAAPADSIVLEYHLRRFRNAGRSLLDGSDRVLDRAGLAWPGDYHALVRTASQFRLVTVRAAGAVGRHHPTEVVAR